MDNDKAVAKTMHRLRDKDKGGSPNVSHNEIEKDNDSEQCQSNNENCKIVSKDTNEHDATSNHESDNSTTQRTMQELVNTDTSSTSIVAQKEEKLIDEWDSILDQIRGDGSVYEKEQQAEMNFEMHPPDTGPDPTGEESRGDIQGYEYRGIK